MIDDVLYHLGMQDLDSVDLDKFNVYSKLVLDKPHVFFVCYGFLRILNCFIGFFLSATIKCYVVDLTRKYGVAWKKMHFSMAYLFKPMMSNLLVKYLFHIHPA